MNKPSPNSVVYSLFIFLFLVGTPSYAGDLQDPEQVIRALVKANADQDLQTLSELMAHDADAIGYTVGGRKYVGWNEMAKALRTEFDAVERIDIPIKDIQVWEKGDVAWFTMEIDYIRYVSKDASVPPIVLELRDSGVLERRHGKWLLVSWHESLRTSTLNTALTSQAETHRERPVTVSNPSSSSIDLRGTWFIEEEDTTYYATLDENGSGPYTHKNGRFTGIEFKDGKLLGTWHQTENDREGGFEVVFSDNGNEARGIWWYTRVGSQGNIPPREHGGTYFWKREPAQ